MRTRLRSRPPSLSRFPILLVLLGFVSPASSTFAQGAENWAPRLEEALITARDYWYPRIDQNYLPAIRSAYSGLEKQHGPVVAEQYRLLVSFWGPILRDQKKLVSGYWLKRHPEFFEELGRVPAPIKIALGEGIARSVMTLGEQARKAGLGTDRVPEPLRAAAEFHSDNLIPSRNQKLSQRVASILETLKPWALDRQMIPCYRSILLQGADPNAFNIGCSVFVTEGLAKSLTDAELAGVLAHELSHADQGHLIKNMGLALAAVGSHFGELIADESVWLLTGKTGPKLQQVLHQGSMKLILDHYGSAAPAIEFEADRDGVRMMERAGYERQALRQALIKLHGYDSEAEIDEEDAETYDDLRDYPSLRNRLKAIDSMEPFAGEIPVCQPLPSN